MTKGFSDEERRDKIKETGGRGGIEEREKCIKEGKHQIDGFTRNQSQSCLSTRSCSRLLSFHIRMPPVTRIFDTTAPLLLTPPPNLVRAFLPATPHSLPQVLPFMFFHGTTAIHSLVCFFCLTCVCVCFFICLLSILVASMRLSVYIGRTSR